VEVFPTRAEAMNRESQIKRRKSKRYIENLIEENQGDWRKLVGMKDGEVG
jgi:predicted GIY-YIG superfamily endonuclease